MKNESKKINPDSLVLRSFDSRAVGVDVVLCNEFLERLLDSNKKLKTSLVNRFKTIQGKDHDDGVKKFNLERWSGGEANPTLEIVMIGGNFKFAMTHFGILRSLTSDGLAKSPVREKIIDFFIDPMSFISA
ncbi:MAG: hypothetical protein WC564_01190 [Patescibacteria group bacterium]|jgi:hypothetical protein